MGWPQSSKRKTEKKQDILRELCSQQSEAEEKESKGLLNQFSEHCEITRALILWDVHDVKNASRHSPRRPSCVGDKLRFPEK